MDIQSVLFSFEGRLGRSPFWLVVVVCALVVPASSYLIGSLALAVPDLAGLVTLAIYLPLLWIALAVGCKRLHDCNRSAGWLALYYLVPALFFQIGHRFIETGASIVALGVVAAAGAAVALWGLADLGFRAGTQGANDFGEQPAAPAFDGVD